MIFNQILRSTVSFILIISLIVILPSYAQENIFKEKENVSVISIDNLEFSVMTEKNAYQNNEVIRIFWEIKNIDNEDIKYTISNTCGDGFRLNIVDSEFHKLNGILGESAKLIKQNDPILLKFESSGFYGNILQLIKEEPDKTRDILVFTSDGKKLVGILKEKFEVTKHSDFDVGPDSGGARVAVKYIPEIASLDIVTRILEGDAPVCGSGESTKILQPNQIISDSFSWSQLTHVKDNPPQQVPDGYYSIGVKFNEIYNCVIIGINTNDSQPEKIPCFVGIPMHMNKEQYIEETKRQLSEIKHEDLQSELIKQLEILEDTDYKVNKPIKMSTQVFNQNNDELSITYQITIYDSEQKIIEIPQTVTGVLEPKQTWNISFEWTPKIAGDYTIEVSSGEDPNSLTTRQSFNITIDENIGIPSWVKNNAGRWTEDQIDTSEFILGIQYLINEGILKVPTTPESPSHVIDEVPQWIKNNAGWWAKDQISDNEFVTAIQWLITNGILKITN